MQHQFTGGWYDRLFTSADRTLAGDVEVADRLNLVAEEFQSQGLARPDGADIEDPPTGTELADAVDGGDALKAGIGQVGDQLFELVFLTHSQP